LVKLERLLEIPVDSQVARQLKHECKALPRWRGVKNLRAEENREYQRVAAGIAAHKGISRVHLDIWYWRAEKGAE